MQGMVVHAYNPDSTQEPEKHKASEFKVIHEYTRIHAMFNRQSQTVGCGVAQW